MRKTFLLLTLAALLMAAPSEAKFNPANAIKPFQVNYKGSLKTICTAWATRLPSGQQVWVTAAHCHGTFTDEKEGWYVEGKELQLLALNEDADLAMYTGGPKVDPLQIALTTPVERTPIWSAGFPFASVKLKFVAGIISIAIDENGFVQYDMAVAPGASGSPVMLNDGLVIGVQQQHQCNMPFPSYCPESKGAPVPVIRAFLGLE